MAQIHGKQIRDTSVGIGKINNAGGQGNLLFATGTSIGMADAPTLGTDLANKDYVDSLASGLDPKESVRVATRTDIGGTYVPAAGAESTGGFANVDLTSNVLFDLNGGATTLAIGDRVLVKNQTDPLQNGIYIVDTPGATGVIERAPDQNGAPTSEVSAGNYTFVETGDAEANKGYVLQGDGTIALNTDPLNWVQFSQAAALSGGDGISIASNTVAVDLSATSGLTFNTAQLEVDTSDGIGLDGNGVRINLTAGGGLGFTGAAGAGTLNIVSDTVTANTVGITTTANGAGVLYSATAGLTSTGETLEVNLLAAGGLEFSGGEIAVNADVTTGATVAPAAVSANGVGVTVDNDTITHTAGTLAVNVAGTGFAEGVQDVVGTMATDSATIDFTYTDGGVGAGTLTAIVIDASITEAKLAASVAGDGLAGGAGTALSVEYSTTGETNHAIQASDLASTATGNGASMIGIEDVAGNYTATNVEAVLAEIFTLINNAGVPVADNKDMTASVTAADEDAAVATTIAQTPAGDSYVQVFVNGVKVVLKGDKTGDCYFSADGGTTAKTIATIATGDTLYWNGSVAGYQLDANDRVDFDYSV